MKWHEKILERYKKKIAISAITFTIFIVVSLLWGHFSGEKFVPTKYEPISYPNLWSIEFYSALAFETLGAFLFSRGFWLFLYKISGNRRDFNRNKRDVWKLIILTTFGLTALMVWIINTVLSMLFNIAMFIVYLLPSAIVTLLLVALVYSLFTRYLSKKVTFLQRQDLGKDVY